MTAATTREAARLLEEWGYAPTGPPAAKKRLSSAVSAPLIYILMDVRMGGMSGIEATRPSRLTILPFPFSS